MIKREEKRSSNEIKTHQVMLNDRIQFPDGKVFVIDTMELTLSQDESPAFPFMSKFEASGRFLGTEQL